jgi:hypothetical protein
MEVIEQWRFIATSVDFQLWAITLDPNEDVSLEDLVDLAFLENVLIGELLTDVDTSAFKLGGLFKEEHNFSLLVEWVGVVLKHKGEEEDKVPGDWKFAILL